MNVDTSVCAGGFGSRSGWRGPWVETDNPGLVRVNNLVNQDIWGIAWGGPTMMFSASDLMGHGTMVATTA